MKHELILGGFPGHKNLFDLGPDDIDVWDLKRRQSRIYRWQGHDRAKSVRWHSKFCVHLYSALCRAVPDALDRFTMSHFVYSGVMVDASDQWVKGNMYRNTWCKDWFVGPKRVERMKALIEAHDLHEGMLGDDPGPKKKYIRKAFEEIRDVRGELFEELDGELRKALPRKVYLDVLAKINEFRKNSNGLLDPISFLENTCDLVIYDALELEYPTHQEKAFVKMIDMLSATYEFMFHLGNPFPFWGSFVMFYGERDRCLNPDPNLALQWWRLCQSLDTMADNPIYD